MFTTVHHGSFSTYLDSAFAGTNFAMAHCSQWMGITCLALLVPCFAEWSVDLSASDDRDWHDTASLHHQAFHLAHNASHRSCVPQNVRPCSLHMAGTGTLPVTYHMCSCPELWPELTSSNRFNTITGHQSHARSLAGTHRLPQQPQPNDCHVDDKT